jgi:antirestriction protein
MSAATTTVEPALYCGTYAKYNDGSIAGKWLKLCDYASAEEFLQGCRDLHRDESDPELMFQDFEGMPRALYGESLSLADLQKLYDWLNLPDDERGLLDEYLEATGDSLDDLDTADVHDKLYCVLDDPDMPDHNTAMGWYVLDEGLIEAPEHLRSYIDVAALGRDWLMDFSVSSNGYVFEV